MLDQFIGYFSDAAARIFGLDQNQYPKTGVQPFEGEIDKKKDWSADGVAFSLEPLMAEVWF